MHNGTAAPLSTFNFQGDDLHVLKDGNQLLVAVARTCAVLGLDHRTQIHKLERLDWACVVIMTTQLEGDTQARETAFIDVDALPMWLATINPGKVAPKLRKKLIAYQREAARVLAEHFLGRRGAGGVTVEQVAQIAAAVCAEVIKTTVVPLFEELRGLIGRQMPGSITGSEVEDLRLLSEYVARSLVVLGDYQTIRAARMAINNHVAGVSGWAGTGRRRHLMPAAAYPTVMASLGAMKKSLDQRLARRRKAKPKPAEQGTLFGSTPVGKA